MFGIAFVTHVAAVLLVTPSGALQNCEAPVISKASTVAEVRADFSSRGKTVLTLMGYSGADYQDSTAMLERVSAVLGAFDAHKTIVNIGASADGIGAAYQVARKKGFETTGIVSSQARESKATFAPCAGTVFVVEDQSWGGFVKGTATLSATSEAIVSVSDHVVAIGGGDIARDEFKRRTTCREENPILPG